MLAVGGGATQIGFVAAAQFLPFALLSLGAGVLADRLDRKRILITSDLLRLAIQLVAGVLLVTDAAEVWHLVVLAGLYGSADAFFQPAFTGLMPLTITESSNLQPANALRSLSFSLGSLLGPVVAGALIALTGAGGAILLDAATFAVSVALLLPLRPRVVERGEPEPFLHDLHGGWREVRSRPWVQVFLLAMLVYHVIVLPSVFVLGPVLAEDEMDGATSWAIITFAFGMGSIAGNLLLLRWRPRFALRAAAGMLIVASCQAVIFGSGLPVPAIAAIEFVSAIGVSCFFTLWETSLQEHIPEHAISRVSSYDYLASAGAMPLGALVAGPVSEAAGIHETLAAMSAIGVAASVLCLATPSVRRLERGTAVPAPAVP
ncbi:MAG: MFS transporter [Solirubrobacterales bacterium]|nr:MFS transporter [Solirubrobacterales bacterium]